VLAFVLSQPRFHAWLMIDDTGVAVCKVDPGFDIDATIKSTVRVLTEVWLGNRALIDEMRAGSVEVSGRREVVAALPRALLMSPMADAVRRVGDSTAAS
jgi:hypothetical protein